MWYQPILGPGESLIGYQVSVVEVISEDNVDQYTTQDTSTTVENLNPYLEYSVSVAALGTCAVASVSITALEETCKCMIIIIIKLFFWPITVMNSYLLQICCSNNYVGESDHSLNYYDMLVGNCYWKVKV